MTNLVSQLVGALEEADKTPAMTELPEGATLEDFLIPLRHAQQAPEWDGGKPANLQAAARDADEWLALIQRLNDAGRLRFSQPDSRPKLDGCRAALSKILCAPAQQAVPMTDEQVDRIWNALPMGNGFWLSFARAVEAHHGITAQGAQEGV